MRSTIFLTIFFSFCIAITSCSSSKSEDTTLLAIRNSGLSNESDSLSYIIGMSLGDQLFKMDSSMNVTILCRAIIDQFEKRAVMDMEEAQIQYLRYLLYVEPERRRGYEERFLSDMAANNRKYTRTKSGLTYNIEVIGNESEVPKGQNDLLVFSYTLSRIDGEVLLPKSNVDGEREVVECALADLQPGLMEGMKMIGKGGKIELWVPSKLAYGESGDEKIGVEPIETLRYNIELLDMDRGGARKRQEEAEKEKR